MNKIDPPDVDDGSSPCPDCNEPVRGGGVCESCAKERNEQLRRRLDEEMEGKGGVASYVSAAALHDTLPSCAERVGAYAIDQTTTAAYVLTQIALGKSVDSELIGLARGAICDLDSLKIVFGRLAGKPSRKVPQ